MSKLLSYFLVENKDSNIIFKKSISQKSTNTAFTSTKGKNSVVGSTSSVPSQRNNNIKSQKLDSKRQLKLTQLIQNTKQPSATSSTAQNNIIAKPIKNCSNMIQQLKSTQIPLQSQVVKQNLCNKILQDSSPICSFTFELKGGIPKQTQFEVVDKQKQKILSSKLQQFYPSPQNYEIETQIPQDSPSSPSLQSQVLASIHSKKIEISNNKRKGDDTLVSEFEINFQKKRSQTEQSEIIFEASPELENEKIQFKRRNVKKHLSFLSQNDYTEDIEETSTSQSNSSSEIFQNMQDLFTCTETLSPNAAALNESLDSDNETQTSDFARSNSKLSLKKRLKMIDSVKKQTPEDELQEFEDSIQINTFEKELNYQQEYLENLIQLEKDYTFDYMIFSKEGCQIDSTMRCIVINWIFELCSDYHLARQTSQTAINLFDRYLSKNYQSISKANIQLVAATCVYISSKKEEQVSPKLKDFIESTKNQFNVSQFLNQELDILNTLNFKINNVCFEEWMHNICQRWDEYISESSIEQNSEQNQKIFFSKKSEESKMRYSQLQRIVDLMQLDVGMNKFKKSVIVLALIYVTYGIYSQDFLLDDVVNYFPNISTFYQKDYFQTYNTLMKSFKDGIFSPNIHTSTSFKEETFIEAIQFVSKFFGYFKTHHASYNMKNMIEQNQRQFIIENGFEFVSNLQNKTSFNN